MTTMASATERHLAQQWANARALSDADALQATDDLLSLFDPATVPRDRIISSGLVEFQRLLRRCR